MLTGLFGNQTIQKVLLFLFVNNKCYGTQLQRLLSTPLTTIQNALSRLEQGGVILSFTEGKAKVYQLNPYYPLIRELELLLKKAYTLLSADEKKRYSLVQLESVDRRFQEPELLSFWERLKTISSFTRTSQSKSKEETGWNGKGKGLVIVTKTSDTSLIFHERGSWQMKEGEDIHFSNTFRWTIDRHTGVISLEHLRLGPDRPIFLFHLTPIQQRLLATVDSHFCEEDIYTATVPWDKYSVRLNWRVIGPKKNETMEYCYI
ncbi:MAG: DUF6314 family protein [Parachlamydiaceae bacterium]